MPRIATVQQMIDQILGDHTEGDPSVLLDGRTACKWCLCAWPCDSFKATTLLQQFIKEESQHPLVTGMDAQVVEWHKLPG